MDQKGQTQVLILAGAVLLIALAGGIFFLGRISGPKPQPQNVATSPQPFPTPDASPAPTGAGDTVYTESDRSANWKILKNTYGYILKYPETLKARGNGIDVNETNAPSIAIGANLESTTCEPIPTSLQIEVFEKKYTVFKNNSLSEIAQKNYEANKKNEFDPHEMLTQLRSTTFAGKPAYFYSMVSGGFSGEGLGWIGCRNRHNVIEVESGDTHYILYYDADPIFDQILSTFKFLD